MYWACWNNATGATAIIYSANDPMDSSDFWDESYPFDTEAEAQEAIDRSEGY